MQAIVFIIILILYIALFVSTYTNMKSINIKNKILFFILGLFVNLIFTLLIVNNNVPKIENIHNYNTVKRIYTLLFTAVNGIISLPNIAKYINNYKMEILSKDKLKIKTTILIIIILVIFIIEANYLKGLKF